MRVFRCRFLASKWCLASFRWRAGYSKRSRNGARSRFSMTSFWNLLITCRHATYRRGVSENFQPPPKKPIHDFVSSFFFFNDWLERIWWILKVVDKEMYVILYDVFSEKIPPIPSNGDLCPLYHFAAKDASDTKRDVSRPSNKSQWHCRRIRFLAAQSSDWEDEELGLSEAKMRQGGWCQQSHFFTHFFEGEKGPTIEHRTAVVGSDFVFLKGAFVKHHFDCWMCVIVILFVPMLP